MKTLGLGPGQTVAVRIEPTADSAAAAIAAFTPRRGRPACARQRQLSGVADDPGRISAVVVSGCTKLSPRSSLL